MAEVKFIEPLFDTQYFKQLFFSKINQNVQIELSPVINDWIMINLYNPTREYHETQTGSDFNWTHDYHCMDKQVQSSVLHMAQDGTVLFEDGYKNIFMASTSGIYQHPLFQVQVVLFSTSCTFSLEMGQPSID